MDIFSWILVIEGAICFFVSVCVALDSKLWNLPYGRGGWLDFIHSWVGWICYPMVLLLLFGAIFYAMFVPLGTENELLKLALRTLILFGLFCGIIYAFLVSFLCMYCIKRRWNKAVKNVTC
ncbi:MAG: hypothetical protein IJ218_04990 [Alphaproteobacteria bacterium]|nr:hypothetical protein [Alphaproteobacteria bacterium]